MKRKMKRKVKAAKLIEGIITKKHPIYKKKKEEEEAKKKKEENDRYYEHINLIVEASFKKILKEAKEKALKEGVKAFLIYVNTGILEFDDIWQQDKKIFSFIAKCVVEKLKTEGFSDIEYRLEYSKSGGWYDGYDYELYAVEYKFEIE